MSDGAGFLSTVFFLVRNNEVVGDGGDQLQEGGKCMHP